jgi:hypothetical protein
VTLARPLYAATIAASALLLFLVQPMIAKSLLPRFGGSAGVWVVCMLFFQVVLLAGYAYSYLVTRHLPRGAQGWVHVALLAASLLALPVGHAVSLPALAPQPAIFLALAATVGLPYFLLSATSPLLQSWYTAAGVGPFPYGLFAISNAASLAALISYPIVIEPMAAVDRQLWWWSAAYVVVAILAGILALNVGQAISPARPLAGVSSPYFWLALAACPAALWLAVANHLSQEVAAVPFLWILPLSLYLLSFIICFDARGSYRPALFRVLLPIAWLAMCWRLAVPGGLAGEIAVFPIALLICCTFCHGELARTKPDPQHGLAFFYLIVAIGGALGAVFVALIAPNVFDRYLELPIAITACILLGLVLVFGYPTRRLVRFAVLAALAFVFATRYRDSQGHVFHARNFYGALQVTDAGATRSLYNGRTLHGEEFLAPALSRNPTAYYGPESGAGQLLAKPVAPRRVALIGLGVGTLAAYGRPGDDFRFYEINPAVVQVASQYFHFLATSPARTTVITGDGRLALAREPLQSFDVIVLDAFSDDSIPVHLLTREAFQIYLQHLRPAGTLAVHLTNRYLDLAPIVEAAAAGLGKHSILIHNPPDPPRHISAADWAIVSDTPGPPPTHSARAWTDGYSNLFQVWK